MTTASPSYTLGVEIEVRVEPHTVRPPLHEKHALYYEKLAAALRRRGLRPKANDLQGGVWRSKNYTEWWITRDGSLGTPANLSEAMVLLMLFQSLRFDPGHWAVFHIMPVCH